MAINIKFTKFDNTPWGFRLAGGSDFPQPLTVIKVNEGSLAECMGIKVGDVVVRLNDQPISGLTHGQAHEALKLAGNNFVLGVQREEEARKALEAIPDENIVPYNISLADLPPVFPEKILSEETVLEKHEIAIERLPTPDKVEELPDKPKDANSEIIPNQNLTDEEIAQLILEEEELLPDKGVLGVNFKKLKPRATVLKGSKVLEELQHIATAPPPDVEERHHISTFLKKPDRPVPKAKPREPSEGEPYKVVIKKQSKKSVIARLVEKGLIPPGSLDTPEPTSEATTPAATPDLTGRSSGAKTPDSRPESELEVVERTQDVITEKIEEVTIEGKDPNVRLEDLQQPVERKTVEVEVEKTEKEEEQREERKEEEKEKEKEQEKEKEKEEDRREEPILAGIERQMAEVASKVDREKIKELVRTEINLEKQLENVQSQLLALKQLPSEIENHLRVVSEQLRVIMELSGVQNGGSTAGSRRGSEEETAKQCPRESKEELPVVEDTKVEDDVETRSERPSTAMSQEPPQIIETTDDEELETETRELDGTISIRSSDDEGGRVKKFVVSYETKVMRSRTASPTPSYGSFEPDPNLSPKDQVIQELQYRKGRKHSQDLWPQAKQLELTFGRRWRCPNDFFNDEMIAEVLSSQAEVIRGKALGVNFKKYEKTNLPNYDHLMNSSVYKMIHKMEREPKKGIPARPPKVNAAEDIIERVVSF
ncbi:calponin homology domain-containing protein DDB_G0272472-like isoform X3 [Vespula pensylvanica]|uniref:calponin homology domain-containing protein DDB_G0272472-like isoform X3 n=1 Tax=Vespula pensylvanica TaxID=30213 RepID=UPI001CBA3749|nr:calponin homology domain-containing protein DDB_G0272472-like isoform X3 [Vespula pensylvanica]